MAQIKPFAALLPPAELAARISCPPYDVVTVEEARQYLRANPQSFMRVIRAEAEYGDEEKVHAHAAKVYARARQNLLLFQREGWLLQQPLPAFLIYRMREGRHVQTGVVACCSVDEYESGAICRHENTRPDKENDRTQHALALSAHAEPVLLAYRGRQEIDELVEMVCRHQPLFDFMADDGVAHTLWLVPEFLPGANRGDAGDRGHGIHTQLIEAFARVPRLYIADGHHRSASASRARAARRASNPGHSGTEEYNFFPAVLFPAGQLRILPYNRVLRRLEQWQPEDFLARLATQFEMMAQAVANPSQKGIVSAYLKGHWHSFALRTEAGGEAAAQLDLSRLQKQLLEPFFGIVDQRTDARVDFIGGKNSTSTIQRLVDSGEAQLGLSLFPPALDELFAISDQGQLMPPKSTWFEPKLRSGLFVHLL